MKVYFVRHGESEGNLHQTVQHKHTKLTDIGIDQAKFVSHRFTKIPVDIILASHYDRAQQTAKIIANKINRPLETHPLLHEQVNVPITRGKHHRNPLVKEVRNQRYANRHDPNWHYSTEENIHDLIARAHRLISSIEKRKETSIAAVTHGNFLRAIISVMMFGPDITLDELDKFWDFVWTKNTGLTICELQEQNWRLLTWNDHAHLG